MQRTVRANSWAGAVDMSLSGLPAALHCSPLSAYYFSAFDQPLFELVPQIAVAPALFTIGLYVIASSLIGGDAMVGATEQPRPQFSNPDALLPAAVSIILTPSGLEYGLAGGLLAYYAYFIFVPKAAQPKDLTVNPKLHIFAFVALLAIIVKLAVPQAT